MEGFKHTDFWAARKAFRVEGLGFRQLLTCETFGSQ